MVKRKQNNDSRLFFNENLSKIRGLPFLSHTPSVSIHACQVYAICKNEMNLFKLMPIV